VGSGLEHYDAGQGLIRRRVVEIELRVGTVARGVGGGRKRWRRGVGSGQADPAF
jgi:hypothetical protein